MRWGGMAGWPGLEPGIPGLVRSGAGDPWAGQIWSRGSLGWSGLELGIPGLVRSGAGDSYAGPQNCLPHPDSVYRD